jgi:hypothetical protein
VTGGRIITYAPECAWEELGKQRIVSVMIAGILIYYCVSLSNKNFSASDVA